MRIHVKRVIDAMGFHFQPHILVAGRHLIDGVGSKGQGPRHRVLLASLLLPVVPFTSCPESPQSRWMKPLEMCQDVVCGCLPWLCCPLGLQHLRRCSGREGTCLYRWSYPSSLTWAQTSHKPPGVRLIDINHQHSKVGLQRLLGRRSWREPKASVMELKRHQCAGA